MPKDDILLSDIFYDAIEDLKDLEDELAAISIPYPSTPDNIREAVSKLDRLYSKILPTYVKEEITYQNLEDLIDETLKTNKDGPNPDARAAKAYEAASQAYIGKIGPVNLLELRRYARSRYLFLQEILKAIEKKHERLITVEGAYNIEAKLA